MWFVIRFVDLQKEDCATGRCFEELAGDALWKQRSNMRKAMEVESTLKLARSLCSQIGVVRPTYASLLQPSLLYRRP
jgi:hypothetical protein